MMIYTIPNKKDNFEGCEWKYTNAVSIKMNKNIYTDLKMKLSTHTQKSHMHKLFEK